MYGKVKTTCKRMIKNGPLEKIPPSSPNNLANPNLLPQYKYTERPKAAVGTIKERSIKLSSNLTILDLLLTNIQANGKPKIILIKVTAKPISTDNNIDFMTSGVKKFLAVTEERKI